MIIISRLLKGQYRGNSDITQVTITNEVTIIPESCFENCRNLQLVIIPSSVRVIHHRAFSQSNVEMIIFEDNSQLSMISSHAFSSCHALKHINIPTSVKVIQKSAFESCINLQQVYFQNTNPQIIKNYTENSENNTNTTTYMLSDIVPTNMSVDSPMEIATCPHHKLQIIGAFAFQGCTSLTTLHLPNITILGEACFLKSSIQSVQFVTDNCRLKVIPDSCFYDCSSLQEISIPSSITTIKPNAFRNSNITSCMIPEDSDLTSIGVGSFCNCLELKKIYIPQQINKLSSLTFAYSGLEQCVFPPQSHITSIEYFCFANTMIKSIKLPSQLRLIGTSSFRYGSMQEITFVDLSQSQLLEIGSYAFHNSKNIVSLYLPKGVQVLHNSAFRFSGIQSIIFPHDSQLKIIASMCFEKCKRLHEICFPKSIRVIGTRAFSRASIHKISFSTDDDDDDNDDDILNDTIDNGQTSEAMTIDMRDVIERIDMDDKDQSSHHGQDMIPLVIKESAFSHCGSLQRAYIPANATRIGESAFYSCQVLSNVIFEKNSKLSCLENSLFEQCINLSSLTLPSSIEVIKNYFISKSGVSIIKIDIKSKLQCIYDDAFLDCLPELVVEGEREIVRLCMKYIQQTLTEKLN